ncbi:hypothetical protein BDV23DRAFT_166631 [Aspergillus alliaceus]|uniref:Uncharacterized protein n=1 Tax=Petromyces alliaceus TaxID=209559 RepID=A0A5N7BRX9_PETAA|nr:hypothetical protein BDV23DRAFT_166631 [Aspergillus alliaceus]
MQRSTWQEISRKLFLGRLRMSTRHSRRRLRQPVASYIPVQARSASASPALATWLTCIQTLSTYHKLPVLPTLGVLPRDASTVKITIPDKLTGHVRLQGDRFQLHIPSAKFGFIKGIPRDSTTRQIKGGPPPSGLLPRVRWQPSLEYDSKNSRAKLTLIATNMTTKAVAFARIKVTMSQVRVLDGYVIFSDEKWEKKTEKPDKYVKQRRNKGNTKEGEQEPSPDKTSPTNRTESVPLKDGQSGKTLASDKADQQDEQDTPSGSEASSETDDEKQAWLLSHTGITADRRLKDLYVDYKVVGKDRLLEFSVLPEGTFPPNRGLRFLFSADPRVLSFTLELEGTIHKAGKYVLQLTELWSDPGFIVKPARTRWQLHSLLCCCRQERRRACLRQWIRKLPRKFKE